MPVKMISLDEEEEEEEEELFTMLGVSVMMNVASSFDE